MKIIKKMRYLIVIIVLAVVIAIAFYLFKKETKIENTVSNHFTVHKMDLDESVNITGKGVSDTVNLVFSDVAAPVKEITVSKGDYVKSGDIICTFDVSELIKQRDGYVQLLEEFEKYTDLKNDNYNDNLSYKNNISDKQLEQLKNTVNSIQSEYDKEVDNESEYRLKYDEAVRELDSFRSDLDSVNAEIKTVEDLIESYKQTIEQEKDEDSDIIGEFPTESSGETVTPPYDEEHYISLQSSKAKLEELYELALNKKEFYSKKQIESKTTAETLADTLKKYKYEYEQMKIQQEHSSSLTAEEYEQSVSDDDMRAVYNEKIEKLNKKINNSTVVAPKDGIITEVFASTGDYVMENAICQIQDHEKMHFEGYITPNNISSLSKENKILISMAANNFEQVEGKILEISDYYDEVNGGYKISFTLDGIDKLDIYPGFEASAKIIISQQKNVLAVPYDAIFEKDGKDYIRKITSESGSFEDIEVEKGLVTSYYVAVNSGNIKEDDVIMTGMLQ